MTELQQQTDTRPETGEQPTDFSTYPLAPLAESGILAKTIQTRAIDTLGGRTELTILPINNEKLEVKFSGRYNGAIQTVTIPKQGAIPITTSVSIATATQSRSKATPIGSIRALLEEVQQRQNQKPQELTVHLGTDGEYAFAD